MRLLRDGYNLYMNCFLNSVLWLVDEITATRFILVFVTIWKVYYVHIKLHFRRNESF